VADALVVCATNSRPAPVRRQLIPDRACVVAVGARQPERRELDADLLGRASVVVEDVSTALREAGDVIQAIAEELAAEPPHDRRHRHRPCARRSRRASARRGHGLAGPGRRGGLRRRHRRPDLPTTAVRGPDHVWVTLSHACGSRDRRT
jgi:hypothetical protein